MAIIMVTVVAVGGCSSRQTVKNVAKGPASPEQVRSEAEQALRYGDHAAALAAWQKILAKTPDDVAALRGIGEVYLAVGEHATALAAFDKADRKSVV